MNILMIGDIVGEPGLKQLQKLLPDLRKEFDADLVVVNGENSYDGKGIRPSDATAIFEAGADVITTGNHVWEKWQSKKVLAENDNVLRPHNYPPGNVGKGYWVGEAKGRPVAVLNLQGRTFMSDIDCPFRGADFMLKKLPDDAVILVDFHAEVTAEKIAMARYLDGRITALVGTHTHVPTADAQIFPKGTAYVTDLGMSGPYESVIGMEIEPAIQRFVYKTPYKYVTAQNDAKVCGVFIVVDEQSRRARSITQFIRPDFNRGTI